MGDISLPPIDFMVYRFILVYVALSDFHIGVMYNMAFSAFWSDPIVVSNFAGHHCLFDSFTGWVFPWFHSDGDAGYFWRLGSTLHLLETCLQEVVNNLVFDDCHF